jgi:septation ring formation regulator EzrA
LVAHRASEARVEQWMSKGDQAVKHRKAKTEVVEHSYEPMLPDMRVREILGASHEEMEALRETLAKQQTELLDRRGHLGAAIRIIDEKLEIIGATLRAIEAHQ